MKNITLITAFLLFTIIGYCQGRDSLCKTKYANIEAFTHPLSTKNSVSIYHSPGKYFKELKPDIEAGWIVQVKEKEGNYFMVEIIDLNLVNIWIHMGDIGVVIENYDSITLPVYSFPDTNSIKTYSIYNTCIGLIYDITDDFFLLQINTDSGCFFGWVERKYLCSSPYTTCG